MGNSPAWCDGDLGLQRRVTQDPTRLLDHSGR